MIKNQPPFYYLCHHCGAHFSLQYKAVVIVNPLKYLFPVSGKRNGKTIGPLCPNCGSWNTAENNLIMK